MKFRKNILLLCFVLFGAVFANAQQFRGALPSPFTNESPQRFFEGENFSVRSFTNPETFSCYVHVLETDGEKFLIDPGYYGGDLKEYVKKIGGVDTVLLSHCHVDHIIGLNAIKKDYPDAKFFIHELDRDGLYDININYSFERVISEPFVIDFDVSPLKAGKYKSFEVISSGGHSLGSALYYFPKEKLLFIGDTVAFGRIPRHDLENSNVPEVFESLMRLKNFGFPDDTQIFFGHGERITYGEMLRTFEIFNKPLVLIMDGSEPVKDFYFDGDKLMISLEEVIKFLGAGYFKKNLPLLFCRT